MHVNPIQDLEDQLALHPQKPRQSHRGWAEKPTSQPADLYRVPSPREWEWCLSWGAQEVSAQQPGWMWMLWREQGGHDHLLQDSRAWVLLLTGQDFPPAVLDWRRDRLTSLTHSWVFIVCAGCSQMDFSSRKQNSAPKIQQAYTNKQSWRIPSVSTET